MYLRTILVTVALYLPAAWVNASLVTIDGQEWQQLRAFSTAGGVSWDDLATACSTSTGACSGELNGVDLNGWVWAEADDVNAMLNGYLPASALGSSALWTDLGPGPDSATTSVDFWARQWSRAGFSPNSTHYDFFGVFPIFSFWAGWLRDDPGALATVLANFAPYPGVPGASIRTNSSWDPTEAQYPGDPLAGQFFGLGAFLFRPAPAAVPAPGTFALMGLSILALRYSRRAPHRGNRARIQ